MIIRNEDGITSSLFFIFKIYVSSWRDAHFSETSAYENHSPSTQDSEKMRNEKSRIQLVLDNREKETQTIKWDLTSPTLYQNLLHLSYFRINGLKNTCRIRQIVIWISWHYHFEFFYYFTLVCKLIGIIWASNFKYDFSD